MLIKRWTVFVMLMLFAFITEAQLYRYTDAQGNVHYTDQPPPQAQVQTVEGSLSIYQAPDIPVTIAMPEKKTSKKVVMYSASWCGVCKSARNYMKSNHIRFTEYDIETSERGKRDYAKFGGKGVPVIFVDDQRMNGFSAERLAHILQN